MVYLMCINILYSITIEISNIVTTRRALRARRVVLYISYRSYTICWRR